MAKTLFPKACFGFSRKLTASGPAAAYASYQASQREKSKSETEGSSVGIPNTYPLATPPEKEQQPLAHDHEWLEREQRRTVHNSRPRTSPVHDQRRTPQNSRPRSVSEHDERQIDHDSGPRIGSKRTGDQGGQSRREDIEVNEADVAVPGAFDRLHYASLKKQLVQYRETVATLQKVQTSMLVKISELPRYCRWECVSKVLTDVVSSFLIGNESHCSMYPTELELVPKILSAFGITMDQKDCVEQFFIQWGKGGENSLMNRVYDNIRDRRGALLRVLRDEFYRQLDSPKPRDVDEVKLNKWKESLSRLKRGREWRMSFDGDVVDPWGSKAVHHSIARALNGIRFDPGPAVSISLPQAGFLLYNLQLAMDGRVMEASKMYLHHKGMKEMEEKIRLQRHEMKRILVLVD